MRIRIFLPIFALLAGCNQTAQRMLINRTPDVPNTIRLTSPAFAQGQPIPSLYTNSRDISPPLQWSNIPAGAKSLVLMMEDADTPPPNPALHWLIYNIPPTASGLPEALPRDKKPKAVPGAIQVKNARNKIGYTHPAPYDSHTHHYHFQIFALDDTLDPETINKKSEVVTAMNGHVLAKGELVGTVKQP